MGSEDKQNKVVGVYERPARADRKRGPWILMVVAVLATIAWIAYFAFGRG